VSLPSPSLLLPSAFLSANRLLFGFCSASTSSTLKSQPRKTIRKKARSTLCTCSLHLISRRRDYLLTGLDYVSHRYENQLRIRYRIKCSPRDQQRDPFVVARRFTSFVELKETFSKDASISKLPFPTSFLNLTGWVRGANSQNVTDERRVQLQVRSHNWLRVVRHLYIVVRR
jgi:hypothetical protein